LGEERNLFLPHLLFNVKLFTSESILINMIKKQSTVVPAYILEYVDTYVAKVGLEESRLADEAQMLFEVQRADIDRRLNAINFSSTELEEEIRRCYVTAASWDQTKKAGYFLALKNCNPMINELAHDLITDYYLSTSAYDWHKEKFKEGNYCSVAMEIEKLLDKAKRGYVGFLNIKYLRKLGGDVTHQGILDEDKISVQLPGIKIKWKASPAIVGCIIDELISKGYIERPTSSYAKDVNVYMQLFEINSTPATLAKELSDRTNSLCANNKSKLTLPKIEQLR